jgi:hypothetical protein
MKQRPVIEKPERNIVFKNYDRRHFTGHNSTEQTVVFRHRSIFLSNPLIRFA